VSKRIWNRQFFRILLLFVILVNFWACAENKTETSLEQDGVDLQQYRSELQQGWNLLERGEYLQALYMTETLLNDVGEYPPTYFLRGRIFSELNQFDKAEAEYKQILEIDPDYQSVHFNLGNNYFRQTRFVSAIEQYKKELANYPDPSVYLNLGRTYYKIDKVDSARIAYQNALDLNENFSEAHYRLGMLLKNEGELAEAKFHTDQALDDNSTNAHYNLLMGQLLYQQQQFEEAAKYMKRVINLDPSNHGANYTLGLILQSQGKEDTAQDYLDKASYYQSQQDSLEALRNLTIEYPDVINNWVNLAKKYEQVGQYSRAIRAYNSALMIQPQNLSIHTNIGNLYYLQGNADLALTKYESVIQRDSTVTDALLNMGVVYANMGNYSKAKNAWQRVLQYDPQNELADNYLSRISSMN
jgi:tetratricopeptide (TPR) repeat protein